MNHEAPFLERFLAIKTGGDGAEHAGCEADAGLVDAVQQIHDRGYAMSSSWPIRELFSTRMPRKPASNPRQLLRRRSDRPHRRFRQFCQHGFLLPKRGADNRRKRPVFGSNLKPPPAVTVHGLAGDWSIFRLKNAFCRRTVGRKHGPVPFPQRQGDSPIFAAVKSIRLATSLAPRKLGQSPVNGYPPALPIPGTDTSIEILFPDSSIGRASGC